MATPESLTLPRMALATCVGGVYVPLTFSHTESEPPRGRKDN
jgi:hypothetical protein